MKRPFLGIFFLRGKQKSLLQNMLKACYAKIVVRNDDNGARKLILILFPKSW